MRNGTHHEITFIGRLGQDPEIKETNGGSPVAKISLPETISVKSSTEEGKFEDKTIWHRITVFGKSAEFCQKFLAKGDSICVKAKNRPSKWMDKEGKERHGIDTIADKVMLISRAPANANGSSDSHTEDDKLEKIENLRPYSG